MVVRQKNVLCIGLAFYLCNQWICYVFIGEVGKMSTELLFEEQVFNFLKYTFTLEVLLLGTCQATVLSMQFKTCILHGII